MNIDLYHYKTPNKEIKTEDTGNLFSVTKHNPP